MNLRKCSSTFKLHAKPTLRIFTVLFYAIAMRKQCTSLSARSVLACAFEGRVHARKSGAESIITVQAAAVDVVCDGMLHRPLEPILLDSARTGKAFFSSHVYIYIYVHTSAERLAPVGSSIWASDELDNSAEERSLVFPYAGSPVHRYISFFSAIARAGVAQPTRVRAAAAFFDRLVTKIATSSRTLAQYVVPIYAAAS